ncbi:MAG: diacylglycerol kinase family protein [Cytophagaceae bacterium]|nr:diacylglycerol kinase family protein [Cytophagaceae bacterium]
MININKCLKSFSFAFKGIYLFFKNENNARVHLLATIAATGLGVYFELDRSEWLWIALAVVLVWTTEAVNTSIEKMVDLIHPNYDPRAGHIKDLAAGAVLMAALFSVIVALIIFLPKII